MFLQRPNHGVERVGDADHKRVRRVFLDALANLFHDVGIDANQIITAHTWLPRDASCDNNNVGTLNTGIRIGTGDPGVKPFDGGRFDEI